MTTFIEYLNPADWSLHVINVDNEAVNEDWILVPEGSIRLTIGISQMAFWNKDDDIINISIHDGRQVWRKGLSFKDYAKDYEQTMEILWQRQTQPEELPFIDDEPKPHNHYFKDVSRLNEIDVYQVLRLFNVTDPCLQHIVKKALCAGQRGHKDFETDLLNIRDTALRAIEINGGDK